MPGLRLMAELGGDGSGFFSMMGKARAEVSEFSSGPMEEIKGMIAGAFTVGAVEELVRRTVEWGKSLENTADDLSVNVEWLQKMSNGAIETGASMDDLAKFITNMNKEREKAFQKPGGPEAQRFERLGITPQMNQTLSTQDFFQKIVDAFKNGATTQMVDDVENVGGRSARKLIAGFIDQFASDAPIAGKAVIQQLQKIGVEFEKLSTELKVDFIPVILSVMEALHHSVGGWKGIGSGLGGAAGAFNPNALQEDLSKTQDKGLQGLKDAWGIISKQVGQMWDAGKSAMFDEGARQDKEDKAADHAQALRDAVQDGLNSAAPHFANLADHGEHSIISSRSGTASKVGDKAAKDQFAAIGGFLGHGAGTINGVANEHLRIARAHLKAAMEHTRLLAQITAKLDKLWGQLPIPPQ